MDAQTQRMVDYSNPPNADSHIEEGRKRYRAGCRCEVCKAAWAAYHRNRRARQAASLSTPDIAYTTLKRVREWANGPCPYERHGYVREWEAYTQAQEDVGSILDGGDEDTERGKALTDFVELAREMGLADED